MMFLLVTTHYPLTGCSIRLRGLWEGDKSGVKELDGVTTDAIVFAVARGWMIVDAGHSICFTDAGRRLMESHTGCNTHYAHTRVGTLKFPAPIENDDVLERGD